MKSKIKKHVFGYDVFEQNVPFSKLEEGDVLLTTENEAKRNHNWSFIRMNDDYIELIDQSYARLGKGLSSYFIISIVFFLYFIGVFIIWNEYGKIDLGSFICFFISFLYYTA